MDGNYSAENVYFSNDFIFTENVGTVEIPESGSITVEAEGLNVKQFLSSIFAKEKEPEVVQPTASIILSPNTTLYEVGNTCTPKYKITFNPGSYSYGPEDTEVTATYTVTDTNGNNSQEIIDTFTDFTVTDDTSYRISAVVSYTDGVIPITNLGNNCVEKQITAGTLATIYTSYIKGYRKTFYGTLDEKPEEMTSDIVRSLKSSTTALKNGSSFTINVPVGALRVVIAYPASLQDMTSVLDKNDSNSNIVSGFGSPISINVEGLNGFEAIEYKMYIMDFANPYDASNVFTVTI